MYENIRLVMMLVGLSGFLGGLMYGTETSIKLAIFIYPIGLIGAIWHITAKWRAVSAQHKHR